MSEISNNDDIRTILLPSAPFGIPEVTANDAEGTWGLRKLGVPHPDVYAMADIASCTVRELECEGTAGPAVGEARGMELLGEVIKNPGKVARANKYKGGAYCGGVYLEVTLRDPTADKLIIPVWGRELKRGSMAYRQVIESAETVKAAFDEMIEGGSRG